MIVEYYLYKQINDDDQPKMNSKATTSITYIDANNKEKEQKKTIKKEKAAGPEAALVEKKANKMTRFSNCDILLHNNDVEVHGFEKTKHIDEMELLAVKNDCRIIIKNGTNGKWYLKGKGKPIEYLKSKIDERLGKSRDGVYCYLLEF